MNRKRWPILCAIALFAVAILVYANFQKKHTFVLANDEGMIKSEQIQPLFGTVKVSGDCDTDVVFTDVETGEKYVVGYITSGVSEKIKLEKRQMVHGSRRRKSCNKPSECSRGIKNDNFRFAEPCNAPGEPDYEMLWQRE